MNEFQTQKGGRKIFNEDFSYLQELINSTISFFADCGINYVISGCNTSDGIVSGGFVFLGGKIRKVEETVIRNSDRPVIIPTYSTIEGKYDDGSVGVIREVYGTAVIPASEYFTGDCIFSFQDNNGKYNFKNVKDTFWKYYMLIKDSDDLQQLFNSVEIEKAVTAINLIIKSINKEVTIKNEKGIFCIVGTDNNSETFKISAQAQNTIKITSGGKTIYLNTKSDEWLTLLKVSIKTLTTDTLDAKTLLMNGKNANDVFLTKEEYSETEWLNIVKVSDNSEVNNLYARCIMGEVVIQGTLPVDFFSSISKKKNDSFNTENKTRYYTNYRLPSEIPSAMVPMAVAFHVISNEKGSIGANVYIDENNQFYLVENSFYQSPEYDGIGQSTFPFSNDNIDGVHLADTLNNFFDGLCPSIVWNFAANLPIKLSQITRVGKLKGDIAFNAATNTLHCWMKYYETKTITNLSDNTTKTETTVKDLRVVNIAVKLLNFGGGAETGSYPNNINLDNYPITQKTEIVECRVGTATNWVSSSWESSGYEFHNPYVRSRVKVTVTYERSENNEYDELPTQEITIRESPSNYYLQIAPGETYMVLVGTQQKTGIRTLSITSQYSMYYETKDEDGDKIGHEALWPCPYGVTQGGNLLGLIKHNGFVNDMYKFTDKCKNNNNILIVAEQNNNNKKVSWTNSLTEVLLDYDHLTPY